MREISGHQEWSVSSMSERTHRSVSQFITKSVEFQSTEKTWRDSPLEADQPGFELGGSKQSRSGVCY